ncbi:MAG: Rho termination factor N-terminal domain-containing protein [Eubacteriales bacterium]|nr:Rho termination factor N-terminal domain-containing protein [Eubacteriales bacterium]
MICGNVERIVQTEEQRAALTALGYHLLKSDGMSKTKEPETATPEVKTLKQLKEAAKEAGIEGYNSLNKAELEAVLKDVM